MGVPGVEELKADQLKGNDHGLVQVREVGVLVDRGLESGQSGGQCRAPAGELVLVVNISPNVQESPQADRLDEPGRLEAPSSGS